MERIETLRAERNEALAAARNLHQQSESRALTPDESAQFDDLVGRSEVCLAQISDLEDEAEIANNENSQRAKRLGAAEEISRRASPRKSKPIEAPAFVRDVGDRLDTEDRKLALRGWLSFNSDGGPTDRMHEAAQRTGLNLASNKLTFRLGNKAPRTVAETRALSTTTTEGGFTVPEGFVAQLEESMLAFGGVREVATVLRTASGNALPIPTVNDNSNTGAILGENTQVAEQDIVFGQVVLNAYKYSSKLVRVSAELLQDTAINLEGFIGGALGTRIGRILNTHFTTGTGSSQPNGVVTASGAGVTAAATDAVTFAELVNLYHALDPAYRAGAKWMMHDATFKLVKRLVDDQNRPIFVSDISSAAAGTILGAPVIVNQSMATAAASAKTILWGDFSKYLIRDVVDFTLLRLEERYADYHQVGFVGFSRHDGNLLDAGTNPIVRLTMAAS